MVVLCGLSAKVGGCCESPNPTVVGFLCAMELLYLLVSIMLCLTFFSGCNKMMYSLGVNRQAVVTVALKLKKSQNL